MDVDVDVDVEEKMKNTVGCFRETRSFAGINLGKGYPMTTKIID